MVWFVKTVPLILILHLFVSACSEDVVGIVQAPMVVAQYDTNDVSFASRKTYSAISPWFNPFTEIDIALEMISPSGLKHRARGFYDGDGNGGLHGKIFKVRICPDEPGLWHWQSQSNLPELDLIKGSFNVTGTLPGVYSQGPVTVLKADPKRFAFSNQRPVFLLGKFLDIDQPMFLKYTHTLFSEQWTDSQREEMLNHQLDLGVNKMNIYLANKGDYGNIATTPWPGISSYNFKSRFDLRRWHQYEDWTKRLRDRGIAAHLWFFADDSGFKDLSDQERDQLITYGMARLSGYVNTLFTLALEWQEAFTESEVREAGIVAQNNNPWERLVSVHGLSVSGVREDEDSVFFDEDWLDFIEIQTGFVAHHKIYELGNRYRGLDNKPLILEEFSLGENTTEQRINTWAAIMTAPAGIGTGSGIKAVSTFLREIDISKFDPAPDLVATKNAYAIASSDGRAVIYVYKNRSVTVTPGKINAAQGQWFDPRTATFKGSRFELVAGRPARLPTEEDWVLLITP